MSYLPKDLTAEAREFLSNRHLASLTTQRRDGSPHVVAVGFTFDPKDNMVRVITNSSSQKAVNARRGGRAVVFQVEGARWLALEGVPYVAEDPESVRRAEQLYSRRYREPRESDTRVALCFTVDKILGSRSLFDR